MSYVYLYVIDLHSTPVGIRIIMTRWLHRDSAVPALVACDWEWHRWIVMHASAFVALYTAAVDKWITAIHYVSALSLMFSIIASQPAAGVWLPYEWKYLIHVNRTRLYGCHHSWGCYKSSALSTTTATQQFHGVAFYITKRCLHLRRWFSSCNTVQQTTAVPEQP